MSKFFKPLTSVILIFAIVALLFGCNSKETVLIYASSEDYSIENLQNRLNEQFPEYNIIVEYIPTGNHAAKLLAEGTSTECDIIFNLEYSYLEKLDANGILADLSKYDRSIYTSDTVVSDNYIIESRNGGGIIINTKLLAQKGLAEPTSYQDLLKPEYKGLISMPNPKSSGTGYMFLKSLVNAWGEDEAFAYFDSLSENILQYTSSGAGPVNALVQGEAAIGLGMTSQAALQITAGAPLKIIFFEEGAPFSLYGQSIVKGKESREAVMRVFDYMVSTYAYENNEKFVPEKIFNDKDYVLPNYPSSITYSDMSGDTSSEKTRLLAKWKY